MKVDPKSDVYQNCFNIRIKAFFLALIYGNFLQFKYQLYLPTRM